MAMNRKHLQHHGDYQLYTYFPNIDYGEKFTDLLGHDQFTFLSSGSFYWLINIKQRHLVFGQDSTCYSEPYYPSCFARQFRYDHIYVGNPNPNIKYDGNLLEGERVWYQFIGEVL